MRAALADLRSADVTGALGELRAAEADLRSAGPAGHSALGLLDATIADLNAGRVVPALHDLEELLRRIDGLIGPATC